MSGLGQKKTVEVVAAVIWNGDEILCVQRGESKLNYISKKWEFPGGKLEQGESESEALLREIKEELNVDVEVQEKIIKFYHFRRHLGVSAFLLGWLHAAISH